MNTRKVDYTKHKGHRFWKLVCSFGLLLLIAALATTMALPAVAQTAPSVWTDKPDYAPEETVVIFGAGFAADTDLVVRVTRPDGSVITGDGSWTPGSDTVTTDEGGNFVYNYVLDGVMGTYTAEVMQSEAVLATTTFTDNINWISVGTQSGTVYAGTGGSVTFTITIDRDNDGTDKTRTLYVTGGLPSGATPSFSPPSVQTDGGDTSSTLTVTVNSTVAAGSYTFTVSIEDTYNGVYRTDTGTLVVRGLTISEAAVDGYTRATCSPGVPIRVDVRTRLQNIDWESTSYQIEGGSATNVDTGDVGGSTTVGYYNTYFNINAPSTPGTYDLTLIAYSDENSSGHASNSFTLTDAIEVGIFGDTFGVDEYDNIADRTVTGWADSDGGSSDCAIRDYNRGVTNGNYNDYLRLRSGDYATKTGINTTGLTNIHLEYTWGQDTYHGSSGPLLAQWKPSSSGSWITVGNHSFVYDTANAPDTHSVDVSLMTGTNTSIDIRFWCQTDSDSDMARVDNVLVTGEAGGLEADYTLTVIVAPSPEAAAGGCHVDGNTTPYSFADAVNLTAVPGTGWQFVSWNATGVDLTGKTTDNPLSFDMPANNVSIQANFEQIDYTLTVIVAPPAAETAGCHVDNITNPYHYGATVNITAHTVTGWYFYNWTGDYSGSDPTLSFNMPASNVSVTANFRAETSLLFTGQQLVVIPSPLVVSATLSGPAGLIGGQTITFTLDINPITGVEGTYFLGNATTNSHGQAVLSVSTNSSWKEDIYTITASFAGTDVLEPSSDSATITVAEPGSAATGGGWYTLPGTGRINFGFTVHAVPNTDPVEYKGQILLINNGKWRLKGILDNYGYVADNRTGSAAGTGKLYAWNSTTMQWDLVDDEVVFCIQFVDNNTGGGTGKDKKVVAPDMFGINIAYQTTGSQPPLPNSSPTPLKGGDILMKDLDQTPTTSGGGGRGKNK